MTCSGQSNTEDRLTQEIETARRCSDRFVIVESLPFFAQFMPNHRTFYGEVVSNTYLRGAARCF